MTLEEKAIKLCNKLKSYRKERNTLYWEQAEILSALKKDDLYKYTGKAKSWEGFIKQTGIPRSSGFQKIANWNFFIVKHEFAVNEVRGMDTTCLSYLTKRKEDATKESVIEALEFLRINNRISFLKEFLKA